MHNVLGPILAQRTEKAHVGWEMTPWTKSFTTPDDLSSASKPTLKSREHMGTHRHTLVTQAVLWEMVGGDRRWCSRRKGVGQTTVLKHSRKGRMGDLKITLRPSDVCSGM